MDTIKREGVFVKVKCHCPCHTFPQGHVKHVRACCDGGYTKVFIPQSQIDKDSLTLKK